MFKQILISILAFLLTIFPNSSTLLGNYQELTFPGMYEVSQQIVDAINNNDVEAFKKYLCPNMKKHDDLDEKIQSFMDAVDDEIIEYKVTDYGGGSTSKYNYYEKNKDWGIRFSSNREMKQIFITYSIADTKKPDDVGIVTVNLFASDDEHPDNTFNEIISFGFFIIDGERVYK